MANVLVTGGDILGKLDDETILLSKKQNINLLGGYIRKTDNRVILRERNFPGCGKHGYALRSRIVWWLHTNEILKGWEQGNIHHKNHDRADDRLNNLEKIDHVQHAKIHKPKGLKLIECICKRCKNSFLIDNWRLKNKEENRGSYCSQECYHNTTHCPYGHEYTEENTYVYKHMKQCKTCQRQRAKERYWRKKNG